MMNIQPVKKQAEMPFMKAYCFLMNKADLSSAEKLMLIAVCRYWPNPYWGSNGKIALVTGFTQRYVEKVLRSLADKGYIKRGYAHAEKNGEINTVRVIVPLCFPQKCRLKVDWIKAERLDGGVTEQSDGQSPDSCSKLPEQQDGLLESNREINKKPTPSPLPAEGQASALVKKSRQQVLGAVGKFKRGFGGEKKKWTPPSEEEWQRRKQEQLRRLGVIK